MQTLASAGLAGALSNAVLYPLEVVRCRMSTDTTGVYTGVVNTFTLISRLEGPGALYRGLLPSVAAILPEAAITYGLFDLLQRGYARMTGRDEAGVPASLTFGVISAFSGQVVAYPLETVSRRMQVRLLTASPLALCTDISSTINLLQSAFRNRLATLRFVCTSRCKHKNIYERTTHARQNTGQGAP
jgi:hypothetical protein